MLRIDGPLSGRLNMDIDRRLWLEVEEADRPRTIVRFYSWNRPTVSLGRFQKPEKAADLSYCRLKDIPVVRRPTGGRAVLHQNELTYAIISNDRLFFPGSNLREAYRVIAGALSAGLRQLEVETELAVRERRPGVPPGSKVQPCFVTPSRHELLHGRRKLAGSAQRRGRRGFLQHGSIPLEIDYPGMAAALGASERVLRQTVVSVSEAAGRPVGFEELGDALRRGFEESFQVRLHRAEVPVQPAGKKGPDVSERKPDMVY